MAAEARVSFPITKQFTPSGGTEDLAVNFNRNLDSTAFPDLQAVETGFRLPAGSATFGRSVVAFTRHIQIYVGQVAYGLTDQLTVGLRVPYWTQDIQVKTALDTRTATVGFNPAVPGGVAPLRVPGTRLATVEDIQAIVERLGFRRITSWADAHVSDIFGELWHDRPSFYPVLCLSLLKIFLTKCQDHPSIDLGSYKVFTKEQL